MLGLVHHEIAVGLGRGLGRQRVVLDLGGALKTADRTGEVLIGARRLGAGAGDDKRGARFVDKNRVDLVHDGKGMAALHALRCAKHHVVAQVIEAELRVGAVRDICLVGRTLLHERHAVLQKADLHAEEAVDLAHPLRVALGEVIVHGDDVHALTGDRVEVAGER